MSSILLCVDLQALLPNAAEPESPQARPLFRALAARPEVTLVYLTDGSWAQLRKALTAFELPTPHYAVAAGGAEIWVRGDEAWDPLLAWQREIGADWQGGSAENVAAFLGGLDGLIPAVPKRPTKFRLSYRVAAGVDRQALVAALRQRLVDTGLHATVTIPDARGQINILPAAASKLRATLFLLEQLGFGEDQFLYAAASGDDLPILGSGLNCVLVQHASASVADEAVRVAHIRGIEQRLYLAQGRLFRMNGCYAAGVLEGVVHFFPQARTWLAVALGFPGADLKRNFSRPRRS